jgi:hypothetical protein
MVAVNITFFMFAAMNKSELDALVRFSFLERHHRGQQLNPIYTCDFHVTNYCHAIMPAQAGVLLTAIYTHISFAYS